MDSKAISASHLWPFWELEKLEASWEIVQQQQQQHQLGGWRTVTQHFLLVFCFCLSLQKVSESQRDHAAQIKPTIYDAANHQSASRDDSSTWPLCSYYVLTDNDYPSKPIYGRSIQNEILHMACRQQPLHSKVVYALDKMIRKISKSWSVVSWRIEYLNK